tara:strand:- start:2467 stop:3333 length:867 start_codon:yes stop_codon:yes gene_type:complete
MPIIINGKQTANNILENIRKEISSLQIKPTLAVINIGNNSASALYIKKKQEACKSVGIECKTYILDETTTKDELILLIKKLNNNKNINGILLQLPLPTNIYDENILSEIAYNKDIDGFHSQNIGELAMHNRNPTFIPCTPLGCIHLLKKYNIQLEGKHVVIIGNSNIVGLPLSLLLLKNKATVTICNKNTINIKNHTKIADIIISACGQPNMIQYDWIKKDSIIIDIGINYIEDKNKNSGKKLVGDVDFDNVKDHVSAITPVPGGIGPMTVAMLLSNTLLAFKLQNDY